MKWKAILPKLTHKYNNGNHIVKIFDDGTKVKETFDPNADHFTYEYPESFDLKITDYCDAGCAYCFLPNTKVKIKNTDKSIEQLKIGDYVWSYNKELKNKELKPIKQLYKHNVNKNARLSVITYKNDNIAGQNLMNRMVVFW